MEASQNFPAVTHQEHPFRLEFLVSLLQFLRRGRFHRTVMPEQIQRRPIPFGGEPEANRAGRGEGIVVLDFHSDIALERAKMAGPRFDHRRRLKIKKLENGVLLSHRGKHLDNLTGFEVICTAMGRKGYANVSYGGHVMAKGPENACGGDVADLYAAGAVRNIAQFHKCVLENNVSNATVPWAIDSALAQDHPGARLDLAVLQ